MSLDEVKPRLPVYQLELLQLTGVQYTCGCGTHRESIQRKQYKCCGVSSLFWFSLDFEIDLWIPGNFYGLTMPGLPWLPISLPAGKPYLEASGTEVVASSRSGFFFFFFLLFFFLLCSEAAIFSKPPPASPKNLAAVCYILLPSEARSLRLSICLLARSNGLTLSPFTHSPPPSF